MTTPQDTSAESLFGPDDAPHTVAGGFQRFNLVDHQQPDAEVEEKQLPNNTSTKQRLFVLSRFSDRYPRTYNVFLKIILPLFILIGLSFLFGYFLALWESGAEKDQNDAALAGVVDSSNRINLLAFLAYSTPLGCLQAFEGDTSNRTALEEFMTGCGEVISNELTDLVEEFSEDLTEQAYSSLTFDWISCREGLSRHADRDEQASGVIDAWVQHYSSLFDTYKEQGLSDRDAEEKARTEATGTDSCGVNVPAGALFWFTVMTTIGFGNTAPITTGGRTLVFTLGFVCILVFTALIGQAGYICLVVVDDLFLRCHQKRLTQGALAALFWVVCLGLWLLFIAALAGSGETAVSVGDEDLATWYWFAYMSITTVGLGDYYLRHDLFRTSHMFIIPLVFLVGFVLLANFLLKLSDVLTARGVSQDRSLEGILKRSRQKDAEGKSDYLDSDQVENNGQSGEDEMPTRSNKEVTLADGGVPAEEQNNDVANK